MRLYKLDDKVLNIKGNASKFLNGITSNTVEAPLNAFLNQHGRIIATVRQKRISDDEILISVPSVAADNLLKHLERYAKLSHADMLPSPLFTFLDLDNAQTVWMHECHPNSISGEEFVLFRLDKNIPLMGVDYQADEFILNVHEYDYVSYSKGCFLGQEPVAKVHNRSQPSRKLLVRFEDECSRQEAAAMTSKAADPDTGSIKGFVFVSNKPPA
jgi:folate-binding protein YgfZ